MTFQNDRTATPWVTVDKDRKITLTLTKSNLPRLGSDTFELKMGKETITFYATSTLILNKELKKNDVRWDVFFISSPYKSKFDKNTIKDTIQEAMKAFGFCHSTENTLSVTVNFTL